VIPLRGPAEIASKLEIADASRLLLVDAPPEFERLLEAAAASPEKSVRTAEARAIRSVKDAFDWILLWQESRVGSRALFEHAVKRLDPKGRLWVVTAMKKVQGPKTPAGERLEADDLRKGFAKEGLSCDREARLSAWHVAYRFTRGDAAGATRRTEKSGR
jgi:hypothetical protein